MLLSDRNNHTFKILRFILTTNISQVFNLFKTILNTSLIFLFFLILCFSIQCDKKGIQKSEEPSTFHFPEIDFIDPDVYDEIKKTCRTYWDLSKMIDSTFNIII